MIKYHPKQEMLLLHAQGQLHLGLANAVSAHCELCAECRHKLNVLTEQVAQASLVDNRPSVEATNTEMDFSDMMDQIMGLPATPQTSHSTSRKIVQVNGYQYQLPRALSQQANKSWSGFGKISRMRLDADDDTARASLLHIDANGEIPEHTHTGREITLLLSGSFEDEFSQYVPGDFIELDAQHKHTPKTTNGCLCYTVVDAPLHFTKGISKLLNPIGELIY
ncbi:ChrR family anti-sigma-E factor [Shewanella sp. Isolate13]|uniref:ChrR family anti-sigma-E factor n=1 Tax=Shewanella sp. Isolate13 TaxID=2908531 RepID=UPI001EFE95DD|nr:ChrR family anti-sigma-E factor [Shewanella sp. Isolate13]MCG9729346.1 ChrR family anti-sigma-E factor [Shewanella sp. Isolate13]